MRIRRAGPSDAAAIALVEAQSTPTPWSEGQVAASLSSEAVAGWVLEDGGEVVGHLLASSQGPEGEVLIVAVRPDRRRRGGAGALLEAAIAFWRERGVEEAFLEVRDDNAAAIALYTAHGWTTTGRRRAYYRDGTDALVLTRPVRTPT